MRSPSPRTRRVADIVWPAAATAAVATWAASSMTAPLRITAFAVVFSAAAIALRQWAKPHLGALTSWAMLVPLFSIVFGLLDLLAPSMTNCAASYATGCTARTALDSALAGGLCAVALATIAVLGTLTAKGARWVLRQFVRQAAPLLHLRATPAGHRPDPTPGTHKKKVD